MGNPPMSICLTTDRMTAVFMHLFACKKLSLEFAEGPWPLTKLLPDTDVHLPKHQQSGWAATGSWGVVGYGTRWPDRWMIADASIPGLVEPDADGSKVNAPRDARRTR